jgi:DNA-binding PadR family transcriptional regulator
MPSPAARPTIQYVLLALIARHPSTGTELAERMTEPLGSFWSAPHSQIYPQLAALVAAGLLRYDVESAGEVRPRKRYRLTRTGRARLRAWLVSRPEPRPPKDDLVMRAYAVPLADRGRARALFAAELATHEARLQEYQAIAAELRATHGPALTDPGALVFGNWAALQAGFAAERARIDWCRWMVTHLDET